MDKIIDIGQKIKDARMSVMMTQEQTAESLGVSRQTISNWENGKTYPDIVSVIKMSDLFHISLDRLLKEEKNMSNYVEYLEESTNVVKSKEKLSKFIIVITYMMIWAFSLIVFWFFTSGSDAMGYGMIFLWIILPVTTFVLSWIIGVNNYWRKLKCFSIIAFGIMYMLAEYATFQASNMANFNKINISNFQMILYGGIISAAGLLIGSMIRCLKKRTE